MGVILLQVHEAVYNDGAQSLLSKCQLIDYGLEVDECPSPPTNPAYLQLDEDRVMYLVHRRGLALFYHRTPTHRELQCHDPYTLTCEDVWDPRKFDPHPAPAPPGDGTTNGPLMLIHDQSNPSSCMPPVTARVATITIRAMPAHRPADLTNNIVRTHPCLHSPEELRSRFIYRSPDIVEHTLHCTTQLATNIFTGGQGTMQRHIKSRFPHLRRHRIQETVASDTLFASIPAINGYTSAQLFVCTRSLVMQVYPLRSESEGPTALKDFIRDIGVPLAMRTDNSKMQDGAGWKDVLRRFGIKSSFTEPHHPWQNRAELYIGRVKNMMEILFNRTGAPNELWAKGLEHIVYVWNRTAHKAHRYRTPLEVLTGDTPDISAILSHRFYDRVLFLDPQTSFPESKEKLGRFVGIADNTGDALCYTIYLEDTHSFISRSVVRPITAEHPNLRRLPPPGPTHPRAQLFTADGPPTLAMAPAPDQLLDSAYTDQDVDLDRHPTVDTAPSQTEPPPPLLQTPPPDDPPDDGGQECTHPSGSGEQVPPPPLPPLRPSPTRCSRRIAGQRRGVTLQSVRHQRQRHLQPPHLFHDEDELPALVNHAGDLPPTPPDKLDQLLHKLFAVRHGDQTVTAEVIDATHHELQPEPEITLRIRGNNHTIRYLYSQLLDALDPDAHPFIGLVGHRVVNKTKGTWDIKVLWGTGEITWEPLSHMWRQDKFSVAAYAHRKQLTHLKGWRRAKTIKADPHRFIRLIRALKGVVKGTHGPRYKFGVRIPRTVREAKALDTANGNTLWQDAIDKELRQIDDYATFRPTACTDQAPAGYTGIPYHVVFDVKVDLRRKARLVAGGNCTSPPKEDVYSGVVGLETIRLGFTLAAINQLEVCAADVGNAYLYGKTNEKVCIKAGPEFGPDRQGKWLIIDKALYGLRSSGARWHEAFADTIRNMGYYPSKADPNLWMKACEGGYEYIATYVDDVLAFGKNPRKTIELLREKYVLKGVGTPEYYLGGDVIDLTQDVSSWAKEGIKFGLSAETYIRRIADQILTSYQKILGVSTGMRKASTPLPENFHPEQDTSELLDQEGASFYRSVTGAINWVVTLGRVDVAFANQACARYNAIPRKGHLEAAMRIIRYLHTYPKGMIVMDPNRRACNGEFLHHDTWGQFYPDCHEEIPTDMPEGKGPAVRITAYFDADHATDTETRRSVSGVIVFVNNTPVKWIAKRQATVESSTHGAELVAARLATETIMELRYKLRMLGVRIDGPADVYGDNNSVVINLTVPSSGLKKKHNSIAFHRVREAVAGGVIRMAHVRSEDNLADICTKSLPKSKHHALAQELVFRSMRGWKTQRDKKAMADEADTKSTYKTHETRIGDLGDRSTSK